MQIMIITSICCFVFVVVVLLSPTLAELDRGRQKEHVGHNGRVHARTSEMNNCARRQSPSLCYYASRRRRSHGEAIYPGPQIDG